MTDGPQILQNCPQLRTTGFKRWLLELWLAGLHLLSWEKCPPLVELYRRLVNLSDLVLQLFNFVLFNELMWYLSLISPVLREGYCVLIQSPFSAHTHPAWPELRLSSRRIRVARFSK